MAIDQEISLEDNLPAVGSPAVTTGARRLSLRANSSWMLAGNAVYAACQWAMLMILARMGTPDMVGQFVLALAVTTPVMVFFMLQLRAVQATDARQEYAFGEYLALRLVTSVLAVLVVGIVSALSGYGRETDLVILAAAISAAIDSICDVVYGFLQQHERLDRMAQSLMLKGPLSLAALAALLFATGQVVWGVLGIAAARIVVLVLWDLRNAQSLAGKGAAGRADAGVMAPSLRPSWQARRLVALATLSFPLGLVMMLIVLGTNIPRYFVEHWLGKHSLGIFGALAYLGMVGTMAVGALGEAATPQLAQCYARGQRGAFARILAGLAGIGAGLGIAGVAVAWLAGPLVLRLLYGTEYAEHSRLLIWTMVASGIAYVASFTGYAVTAARYFRSQMPLFVAVVVITAVACYWLVPAYGLYGAALAMCVTALAQLVGRLLILWHALANRVRAGEVPCPSDGEPPPGLAEDLDANCEPIVEA